MDDDAVEVISQLRTFVEERFRALNAARSVETRKSAARTKLREIEKVIHQLENLNFPIPEDINAEKAALEKFLAVPIKDPGRERGELVSLAKNLESLAR